MFPTESLKSFKIAGLVKNTSYVKGGLYSSSFWFAMNKGKFASISKADQNAIMGISGEKFARLAGAGWDRADKEGLVAMKEAGGTIKEVKREFIAELKKVTERLERDYGAKMDAMGIDGAGAIKFFRAEVARVAAEK
jgi:TRAP-type C4-dicarboxylate transport system substrate-binding protein